MIQAVFKIYIVPDGADEYVECWLLLDDTDD
jgi:hypothetical protein